MGRRKRIGVSDVSKNVSPNVSLGGDVRREEISGLVGRAKMRKWMELLDSGMSVEEANAILGVMVSEIGDWMEDEEFREFMARWREGMKVIVESRLAERAKGGSVTGAVKFLASLEPERWSERVMVRQIGEERREIRVVFAWRPSDAPRAVGVIEEVPQLPAGEGGVEGV